MLLSGGPQSGSAAYGALGFSFAGGPTFLEGKHDAMALRAGLRTQFATNSFDKEQTDVSVPDAATIASLVEVPSVELVYARRFAGVSFELGPHPHRAAPRYRI